jgi:WD40 repeat protein
MMAENNDVSRKTKIFISYSRKNKLFARKLYDALDAADIYTWVDWEGIPLSADWMAEITAAIEGADAFVFIMSPDSLKSKVCMDELELGIKCKKKIIPVLFAEPEKGKEIHPKLAATNWVYMRPKKDDFDATIPKLVEAIQTDLGWIQQHTRILQRATEWDQKQRNKSYLLHGSDLDEGEQWMTQANTESERDLAPVQAEYIHASRKLAVQRQRSLTIGVGIALIISVFLGFTALGYAKIATDNEKIAKTQEALAKANEQKAQENERKAEESKREAEKSEQKALEKEQEAKAQRSASDAKIYQDKEGELDTSTLLAVNAYTELPNLPEAEDILRQNLSLLAIPVSQVNVGARISKIQVSSDRTRFVTSDEGGKACVWSTQDGSKFFCTQQDGALYDSVLSRDGKILATGSDKGVVSLWDANTGELKKSFQYEGTVWDLSIHPNGRWLGVGGSKGIGIIDMTDMSEYLFYALSSEVYKIDFDSLGKYMAVGMSDGNVSIWDIMKNRTIAGPHHNNEVFHVVFSPDGSWVISVGADSTARAIKIGDGNRQNYSITHGDWVQHASFGPDSSWFVTASDDGFVRVIDTLTGQERMRMAHADIVTRARVSGDGQWIASTGYDHTARIWDASSGTEVMQIPVEGIGSALDFNPDSTRLIVGDRSGNITLWDVSRLHARAKVAQFPGFLHEAHFLSNGERLVANSDDKKVWLINLDQLGKKEDGRQKFLVVKGSPENMAVSRDLKWIAVVEYDANIASYNRVILKSMDGPKEFVLSHDTEVIHTVVFTPDNKQVITADENGLVCIWDVATGEKAYSLTMDGDIVSMAISPDGKYLVAGVNEDNKSSLVWDLDTQKQVSTLEQFGSINIVQFSNDGKLLATGSSEGTVYLWDVKDGVFSTGDVFNTGGGVSAMEFNPADDILAIGDSNGHVHLLDVTLGQEVARLGHIDKVTSVSFLPDGKQLVTVSQKGAHIWDMSSIQFLKRDQLIETACSRLVHNFSKSKWTLLFSDEEYRLICPNLPAGED